MYRSKIIDSVRIHSPRRVPFLPYENVRLPRRGEVRKRERERETFSILGMGLWLSMPRIHCGGQKCRRWGSFVCPPSSSIVPCFPFFPIPSCFYFLLKILFAWDGLTQNCSIMTVHRTRGSFITQSIPIFFYHENFLLCAKCTSLYESEKIFTHEPRRYVALFFLSFVFIFSIYLLFLALSNLSLPAYEAFICLRFPGFSYKKKKKTIREAHQPWHHTSLTLFFIYCLFSIHISSHMVGETASGAGPID
jgi:hypothetical protein